MSYQAAVALHRLLQEACEARDVSKAASLLRTTLPANLDINCCLRNGWTALYHACANADAAIAELLLRPPPPHAPADPNVPDTHGFTALWCCCAHGNCGMVDLLLAAPGIDANRSQPIVQAAANGNVEVVRRLMGHPGIDVNARDSSGFTAVGIACLEGHFEVVEALLNSKEIVVFRESSDERHPLVDAIRNNHIEIAQLLIGHGCTVPPHYQAEVDKVLGGHDKYLILCELAKSLPRFQAALPAISVTTSAAPTSTVNKQPVILTTITSDPEQKRKSKRFSLRWLLPSSSSAASTADMSPSPPPPATRTPTKPPPESPKDPTNHKFSKETSLPDFLLKQTLNAPSSPSSTPAASPCVTTTSTATSAPLAIRPRTGSFEESDKATTPLGTSSSPSKPTTKKRYFATVREKRSSRPRL